MDAGSIPLRRVRLERRSPGFWTARSASGGVRFTFGPLRHLLVTPQFHHWHQTAEADSVDRNFAIHLPLPWIDRIFGTHYLPGDRWPERYGVDGLAIAPGYVNHLIHPFRTKHAPVDLPE
jgi:sterol desaturase/sphingolipid hydroxylase (fatty acid hydroxylase superfamily)